MELTYTTSSPYPQVSPRLTWFILPTGAFLYVLFFRLSPDLATRNVNCCGGTHVATTGAVRPLRIERVNHRPTKQELEFVFTLGAAPSASPSSQAAAASSSSTTTASSTSSTSSAQAAPAGAHSTSTSAASSTVEDVHAVSQDILAFLASSLGAPFQSAMTSLSPHARTELEEKIHHRLVQMKNASYARGFTARMHDTAPRVHHH